MKKWVTITPLNSPGYDFLAELISEKSAIPELDQDLINTKKVLVDLACSATRDQLLRQRNTLETLCRKIEVARCIRASYENDWTKHDGSEKLAAEWVAMLAGVFLAACDTLDGESSFSGLKLKYLNSAMTALDVVGKSSPIDVSGLNAWAKKILNNISGEKDFAEVEG